MFQTRSQSVTPIAYANKMKNYFTNPVSHDIITPHDPPKMKIGKRHVQPIQKMQKSSSGIRINDTNRSQFSIGHQNCLFSQHQAAQAYLPQNKRGQGKQRPQLARGSKSAINLHTRLNYQTLEPEPITQPVAAPEVTQRSLTPKIIDQQVTQRSNYAAEAHASSHSEKYASKRRESSQNCVSVSPVSQEVFAAHGAEVYKSSQDIFRQIKTRNGMEGRTMKGALTSKTESAGKENFLTMTIKQVHLDAKNRTKVANKRDLTSYSLADRLKQASLPTRTDDVFDLNKHARISKLEDSIFVDSKSDRTLNQLMTSKTNPILGRHSRSPTFGGHQPQPQQAVKYTYVEYEKAVDDKPTSQKPNNVTMEEYSKSLNDNRHDLKLVARFEVDRANRKVERAANQRVIESKKQKQNFSICDQGPSHGPGYQRPHTMIYSKGLKESYSAEQSMISITNHPKRYNRRRTENTIYAQDYLKAWNKIQNIQPVLETTMIAAGKDLSMISFNKTQNANFCNTSYLSGPSRVTIKGSRAPEKIKSRQSGFGLSKTSTRISTNDTLTQGSGRYSAISHPHSRRQVSSMSNSFLNITADDGAAANRNTSQSGPSSSGAYMNQTKASKSKQVIR